jgi:small subunit ribosomal protein S20
LPNIKAAEKWQRQTDKRTTRNKDVTTRLKTIFKKAVATQDGDQAKSVESQFDKAAKTGVIHKNKAARKKSRLAKSMARAAVAATAPAKAKTQKSARKTGASKNRKKK